MLSVLADGGARQAEPADLVTNSQFSTDPIDLWFDQAVAEIRQLDGREWEVELFQIRVTSIRPLVGRSDTAAGNILGTIYGVETVTTFGSSGSASVDSVAADAALFVGENGRRVEVTTGEVGCVERLLRRGDEVLAYVRRARAKSGSESSGLGFGAWWLRRVLIIRDGRYMIVTDVFASTASGDNDLAMPEFGLAESDERILGWSWGSEKAARRAGNLLGAVNFHRRK